MENTTMTDDKIALRALLEKGSDTTLLREMIGFVAHRPMELETDTLCGASHGERSDERVNHRNRYRDRDWQTRAAGSVELRFRSCAKAVTSLASWSRAASRRRR
jgi:putative transposase